MTEIEFTDLFEKHLRGLWPDWEPSRQEISLWSDTFIRCDEWDVRTAISRHKSNSRYRSPRIYEIRKELGAVIRERKLQQQRPKTDKEWPGQIFLVTHTNDAGQIDYYAQPFFVSRPAAEVTEPFVAKRGSQHTEYIKARFAKRYPGGFWAHEVLTEKTLVSRLREIRIGMMDPADQEKSAKVELAILDGKIFKDIHGMVENLSNQKSIAEQKADLIRVSHGILM